MKNILLLKDDMSVMGGREKVVSVMTDMLQDECNIHLLSMVNSKGKPFYHINEKTHYSCVFNGDARFRDILIKGIRSVHKYIKQNNIDIVFAIGTPSVMFMLLGAMGTKAKTVYCEHSSFKNTFIKKDEHFFQKLGAKHSDKLVTLTEMDMQAYKAEVKIKNEPTFIYNSIDDNLFKAKATYDVSSKRIVTVGRFNKVKGFDMLVKVAKMVFERHPDWTWEIYGDGQEFDSTAQMIKDENLESNLILKGPTSDSYQVYKNAAFYVMTSYHEGLPVVLLEAKASRLPIVSFDIVTGPREIVTDGVDGFLIPPYDMENMADKICELIEQPDLRKGFSDNYKNNMEKFSTQSVKQKWINLINSL